MNFHQRGSVKHQMFTEGRDRMAGTAANAIFLGASLGSRDPQHIRRWVNAMHAGRVNGPKCVGVTSLGAPCQRSPMRQSCYCASHQRQSNPQDRERVERHLEQRCVDVLKFGGTPKAVREAHAGLRRIARHRLHRQWKHDPRLEGETISFSNASDRERVHAWIRDNCGVDIDRPLPDGRMLTPRALDRCRWAGWRVVRSPTPLPDQFVTNAKNRVRVALRDDARFWAKWEALGEPDDIISGD
jgi:hypothetical protein